MKIKMANHNQHDALLLIVDLMCTKHTQMHTHAQTLAFTQLRCNFYGNLNG